MLRLLKFFESSTSGLSKQAHIGFCLLFVLASFSYSMTYCHFYVSYLLSIPTSLSDSLHWAVRKFGLWWLLVPSLVYAYSQLDAQRVVQKAIICVASIIASAFYSVYLDLSFYDVTIEPIASLVIFLPTHIATGIFILMVWSLLDRRQISKTEIEAPTSGEMKKRSDAVTLAPIQDTLEPKKSNIDGSLNSQTSTKFLEVQKGDVEIQLSVDRIESISAAGNYMEVDDGSQCYLVRATMKELESELIEFQFVRIHRSHLVNTQCIVRIDQKNNVQLASGKALPVSQRYKRNISKISVKSVA